MSEWIQLLFWLQSAFRTGLEGVFIRCHRSDRTSLTSMTGMNFSMRISAFKSIHRCALPDDIKYGNGGARKSQYFLSSAGHDTSIPSATASLKRRAGFGWSKRPEVIKAFPAALVFCFYMVADESHEVSCELSDLGILQGWCMRFFSGSNNAIMPCMRRLLVPVDGLHLSALRPFKVSWYGAITAQRAFTW